MTVAEGLKRFRRERQLTQEEVADAIGIHRQAYQRYEAGRVLPIITFLIKLADAYDVSIDYLIGRDRKVDGGNVFDLQDNEQKQRETVCRTDASID